MPDPLKLSKPEVIARLKKAIEQDMYIVDDHNVHPMVRRDANESMQLNMRVVELLEAQG